MWFEWCPRYPKELGRIERTKVEGRRCMQSFHFATRVFELGCRVIVLRRYLRRAPKGSQGDVVGFVGSYRVSSEHSVYERKGSCDLNWLLTISWTEFADPQRPLNRPSSTGRQELDCQKISQYFLPSVLNCNIHVTKLTYARNEGRNGRGRQRGRRGEQQGCSRQIRVRSA